MAIFGFVKTHLGGFWVAHGLKSGCLGDLRHRPPMGLRHVAGVVPLQHTDVRPAAEVLDDASIYTRPLSNRAERASQVMRRTIRNPGFPDKRREGSCDPVGLVQLAVGPRERVREYRHDLSALDSLGRLLVQSGQGPLCLGVQRTRLRMVIRTLPTRW